MLFFLAQWLNKFKGSLIIIYNYEITLRDGTTSAFAMERKILGYH